MPSKVCFKCNVEKDLSLFNNCKKGVMGKKSRCRVCTTEDNKKYRQENRERIIQSEKDRKNKPEYIEYHKKYRERNKEKIKEINKMNYIRNREYRIAYRKKYYEDNRDRILHSQRNKKLTQQQLEARRKNKAEYRKKRMETDPVFAFSIRVRDAIRTAFSRGGFDKGVLTKTILGCSFSEAIEIIGINLSFDIDHIIPVRFADSEYDVYALNHISNLQFLPPIENRYIKKDSPPTYEEILNVCKNNPRDLSNVINNIYAKHS